MPWHHRISSGTIPLGGNLQNSESADAQFKFWFQGVLEGRHPGVHLHELPGQGAVHQVLQRGDGHQPQRHREHAPGTQFSAVVRFTLVTWYFTTEIPLGEEFILYSAIRPLRRKVLKLRLWEIIPDWWAYTVATYCPAQVGPHNFQPKP